MILSSILSLFLTTKMKNLIKSRKGQVKLNEVPNMVTVLLVIGLMVFIGVFLFVEFRDTSTDTATADETANETIISFTNVTGNNLAASAANVDCVATVSVVLNGTGDVALTSGNYTVDHCVITPETSSIFIDQPINVTYTYTYTEQDNFYNQTRNAQEGVSNLSDFQGLFGLVIAASVILGLIFVLRRF